MEADSLIVLESIKKIDMKEDWEYGILDDAVFKGSSNISLNKIQDEIVRLKTQA